MPWPKTPFLEIQSDLWCLNAASLACSPRNVSRWGWACENKKKIKRTTYYKVWNDFEYSWARRKYLSLKVNAGYWKTKGGDRFKGNFDDENCGEISHIWIQSMHVWYTLYSFNLLGWALPQRKLWVSSPAIKTSACKYGRSMHAWKLQESHH